MASEDRFVVVELVAGNVGQNLFGGKLFGFSKIFRGQNLLVLLFFWGQHYLGVNIFGGSIFVRGKILGGS